MRIWRWNQSWLSGQVCLTRRGLKIVSEIVTAGYSLDGESLPEDELAPYIQTAIDQINFVIGDASTNAYGVSDSFKLWHV